MINNKEMTEKVIEFLKLVQDAKDRLPTLEKELNADYSRCSWQIQQDDNGVVEYICHIFLDFGLYYHIGSKISFDHGYEAGEAEIRERHARWLTQENKKQKKVTELAGINSDEVIPSDPQMVREDGKVMKPLTEGSVKTTFGKDNLTIDINKTAPPPSPTPKIPELSDEDILLWAFGDKYDRNNENDLNFFLGAKFYRELLKHRQWKNYI